MGGNLGKNVVIAGALIAAGFVAAWLRFRPYLGTEGSYTDGVQTYEAEAFDQVRYAVWEDPEPLPGDANSREAERKPALSPDGRHIVFVVGERRVGTDLWIADLVDGEAVSPRPLSAVNSASDDIAPAFAGGSLWFASNRPGSEGGLDLWRASYDRGAFGPPRRVEGNLNTAADDTDPAPVPGSDLVVFASNRGKVGAYPDHDLFVARPLPVRTGEPPEFDVAPLATLNSGFDERDPTFTADGRALVFASDREGGQGGFDLYRSGLLPGATVDGMGQGWVPPDPLDGVNGPADERGPLLSLDGFTLYFGREVGLEGDGPGPRGADLFRASSKELFRTPGKPVGWRELLLVGLLLLLALLAALAKRWRGLDVLYKCVLISLLVHLLMAWWAREVYPDPVSEVDQGDGQRTRVRLLLDPNSLQAQRNQERAGDVEVARTDRELESERPERAELEATEVEREVSAEAREVQRAETEVASAPERRAVRDVERTSEPERTTEVELPSESFDRLAEAAPTVEVEARDARPEAGRRPVRVASSEPSAQPRIEATEPTSTAAPAPSSAAKLSRSRTRPDPTTNAVPTRRRPTLDRGTLAAVPDVEVAAPTEVYVPPTESSGAGGAPGYQPTLEVTDLGGSFDRRRRGDEGPSGPSRAASSGPVGEESSSSELAVGPRSLAPLERSRDRSSGSGPVGGPPAPAFRVADLAGPSRSSDAPTVEVRGPSSATGPIAAESGPAYDPLAELTPGGAAGGIQRSRRDAPAGGPARAAAAAVDVGEAPDRSPLPGVRSMEVADLSTGSAPAALPERDDWDATPYQSRSGAQKIEALDVYGGSEETERAVTAGLRYLAGRQRQDGRWGRIERDDKYGYPMVGKTGLAMLAFLGAGHTPTSETEYSAVVSKGVEFLLGEQDPASGHFGDTGAYSHAIATYALAECYALTNEKRLREPLERAVQHIVDNQHSSGDPTDDGGWGYFYGTNRIFDSWPRASVTAWQVMALESAQLGGLTVPKQVFRRAASFLAQSWDPRRGAFRYSHDPQRLRSSYPTLPGSTPASIFALSLLGADVTASDFRAARRFVMERMPNGYNFTSEDDFVHKAQANLYFWYYGTLAMFRVGGDDWKRWNTGMKETLLPAQEEDGSWRPISIYAEYAQDTGRDRVYTTAMCVLTLEVYYRYFTPLLKVE